MNITKKEMIIVVFFLLLISMVIGGKFLLNSYNKPTIEIQNDENMEEQAVSIQNDNQTKETEIIENKIIVIDICGEVKYPGVVKLQEGARIIDAVDSAGGLLESADRRQVNMARLLLDGEQIYIPKVGENNIEINSNTVNQNNVQNVSQGKININRATLTELKSLDGIGDVLAERIIQYREQNGPFSNVSDLKNVSGIGDKKFESIKDSISVN